MSTHERFEALVKLARLGLGPGATLADVKKARKRLSAIHHPDRFGHDPLLCRVAEEKLKRINAACDWLIARPWILHALAIIPGPERSTDRPESRGMRTGRSRAESRSHHETERGGILDSLFRMAAVATMTVLGMGLVSSTSLFPTSQPVVHPLDFYRLPMTGLVFQFKNDTDPPQYLTGEIHPPKRVWYVAPRYPREARLKGMGGRVVMEIVVNRFGAVGRISVSEPHPAFNDAAVSAVREWRYRPARRDGLPVSVYLDVTVEFDLGRPTQASRLRR